jgi:tRNA(adenine34) deaminase
VYAGAVETDTESERAGADADARFMREALAEAEAAAAVGDVPVGAVVVDAAGVIVGRGRNRREAEQDPTGHAEVDALRRAAAAVGHWRQEGATVYVTLEPCPMCAGALVNARVARVVYGCADPKAGAVDTLFAIGRDARLNHRFASTAGVLGEECAGMLKAFFAKLRGRNAKASPATPDSPDQGPSSTGSLPQPPPAS